MDINPKVEIDPKVNERVEAFANSLMPGDFKPYTGQLYTGVDLGTAYIVTAVVDDNGIPVAGVLTQSISCIRDGLVLDYLGAISILKKQVETLHRFGYKVSNASAAYPPGTEGRNANAFANVLEAAGLEVKLMTDEPTAASRVLGISDGAVVDIGGGTTGISIIRNGKVIYTADEATGGIHVNLVIAGHYKVSVQDAEKMKMDTTLQSDIFEIIRPVFQKIASIVNYHLRENPVETIYMVGGTSCFPGIETVLEIETGLNVLVPQNPLLVTPLGIALSLIDVNEEFPQITDIKQQNDGCSNSIYY